MKVFSRIFTRPKLGAKQIAIAIGIPFQSSQFRSMQAEGSDFVASLYENYGTNDPLELWLKYKNTAEELSALISFMKKKGVRVVFPSTKEDFVELYEYENVLILAHLPTNKSAIEFNGHYIDIKDFIDNIPREYHGTIDLSSCYSASFQMRAKAHSPSATIIAVGTQVSVKLRCFIFKHTIKRLISHKDSDYLDALGIILARIYEAHNKQQKNEEDVYLGRKLQSTVYAPCEAVKGEDFIVSVFVHKPEESDEVEIRARSIDENAQKRNELKLKTKLKRGDVIDFQFTTNAKADFDIDERIKSIIWDNEIESIEFIVSVSADCQATQFVGKIKIAVNKAKVGDMIFKTNIRQKMEVKGTVPCADFDFVRYDGEKAAREQGQKLLNKLNESRKRLQNINPKDSDTQRELDMCEKCLEILSHHSKEKHNRLEVFISSTSDMKPYRDIIREQVEACEMYPDMYEKWGQGNAYPRDMCCQHVLNADIFVCVLGANYGFVEKIWNKSMTEIEYRIAVKAGIPILIYILDDTETQNIGNVTDSERQEELINELKSTRLVGMFKSELNLRLLVNKELLVLKNNIQ